MTRGLVGIVCVVFCCASCNYFASTKKTEAVARVGENYLYEAELDSLVPDNTPKEDSTLIIKSYINNWVTQKLLVKAAERNVDDAKKEELNALIKQYKNDLYTKAYIEKVVQNTIDTVVSEADLKKYYNTNKENFKTNGTILQLRYVQVSKDHPKLATIKSKFATIQSKDDSFWQTYQVQFKSSALNDTVWVTLNEVYRKLPFITPENYESYITDGASLEKSDGADGLYLVKIKRVVRRNQISPYEYVKPTLKQVILNGRKLELIKKFEKEITDDAIKNKEYEIYK